MSAATIAIPWSETENYGMNSQQATTGAARKQDVISFSRTRSSEHSGEGPLGCANYYPPQESDPHNFYCHNQIHRNDHTYIMKSSVNLFKLVALLIVAMDVLQSYGDDSRDTVLAAPLSSESMGWWAQCFGVGDLNRDGLDDIVIGTAGSTSLFAMTNSSTGHMVYSGTLWDPGSFHSYQDIALGDIDGDGNIDVVATTKRFPWDTKHHVSIYLGLGNGTFAGPTNLPIESHANSIALGDINDDGCADIILGTSPSRLELFLSSDSGGWSHSVQPAPQLFRSMDVADLNGDSLGDLVGCTDRSNRVDIAINEGAGRFRWLPPINLDNDGARQTYRSSPQAPLSIADLNGDGILDLLYLALVRHEWAETVIPVTLLGDGQGQFSETSRGSPFIGQPSFSSLGDLNGDGLFDLVVASAGRGVGWALAINRGDGSFADYGYFPISGNTRGSFLSIRDFNGDGLNDVIATTMNQRSTVFFRGLGQGEFEVPTYLEFDPVAIPRKILTGDFNGDGMKDLAVGVAGLDAAVFVFLAEGLGKFSKPERYIIGSMTLSGMNDFALGDANGDGILDLFVATPGNRGLNRGLALLLGTTSGRFSPVKFFEKDVTVDAIVVRDFNRNGYADYAGVRSERTMVVGLADGDGGFLRPTTYDVGDVPIAIDSGDLDGDGILDIVVLNSRSESLSLFYGLGNGAFTYQRTLRTEAQPRTLALHDINQDGRADILLLHEHKSDVRIILGGDSEWVTNHYRADRTPRHILISDLNRDGFQDLILATDYVVEFAPGDGTGRFGSREMYDLGVGSYSSMAVADLNGDSRPDLASLGFGQVALAFGRRATQLPRLDIEYGQRSIQLRWQPMGESQLMHARNLDSPTWSVLLAPRKTNGNTVEVRLPIANGSEFFRLRPGTR